MLNANDNYPHATCADSYYRLSPQFPDLLVTSGAMQLAEDNQAYWFLTVIASYQPYQHFQAEEFQTWELKRLKNHEFLVTATDGNENILCRQKIPFSDFPADIATLWNVSNTIMLPREY